MKIDYQSFDPSVNPGLFPSATVKELKTAGALDHRERAELYADQRGVA